MYNSKKGENNDISFKLYTKYYNYTFCRCHNSISPKVQKQAWGKIIPDFPFEFGAFPPVTGADFCMRSKTMCKMSDYYAR